MNLDYDIIPEVIIYFLGFFLIYCLIYRRYIFSVVDPLFVFIITTSFASVLVIEIIDDARNIAHFLLCQFFLCLGFVTIQKYFTHIQLNNDSTFVFKDYSSLKLTIYILLALYVGGNLIIFFTKGFALLSDTPSNSKIGNFQGGFGIFRKINWATSGFITPGLLFFYMTSRRKKYIFLLMIVAFFTALEGSKGSLVRILTSFGFLAYHPFFKNNRELLTALTKYIPLGLFAVLLVTFIVLSKENDDTEQVFFAFIRRLLYSGDSILYYYTPINENYFAHYNLFDYPDYILNNILGFLRITPYREAFGNIMVENALPSFAQADVIVGPNTPFYLEGKIFFGYYGAFVHSFIVGGIYSFVRIKYFSIKGGSAFLFIFSCSLCLLAGTILIDTSLFITVLFDTCFWILPTYLVSCFIVNKKLVVKRSLFKKLSF